MTVAGSIAATAGTSPPDHLGPEGTDRGAPARILSFLSYRRPPITARYLAQRLLTGAATILVVVSVMFFAVYSTGNPAILLVSQDVTPEELARITALYGFDQPVHVQYWEFVRRALSGDFPASIRYDENPISLALERLPYSILLGGLSLALAFVIGSVLGYMSAKRPESTLRSAPISVATALESIPSFFLAILLIWLFAINLGWLPTSGSEGPIHLVLPLVTLVILFVPAFARVFRASVMETLKADHIRFARARDLPASRITLRHVVVGSFPGVLNVLAIQAGVMIGGSVVIEAIFSWPGIGQLFINAINGRDYPLVLACSLVMAVGFVVFNLVADILSAAINRKASDDQ